MTLPRSLSAYQDCEAYFAKAAESPSGVRITVSGYPQAVRLRQKLNKYRTLLRLQSTQLHEPGDPRHNTSPYDDLAVSLTAGDHTLTIKRHHIDILAIEVLPEEPSAEAAE